MVRTVQTLLRSQLACRSRQHDRKCRLKVKSIYFNHPSLGNSYNYYLILGLRDKAAPQPTSQPKFPPKRVKNPATPSSIFIFISSTGELCSQPIRDNDRRLIGRMFPKHVAERSFLDPEYKPFDEYFQLGSANKKVRPIKNQLIIIMYIYHALINALSAHMIHINLNMIFCTHVKHSPTKTIYIKYYLKRKKEKEKSALQTHTHTRARARAHTHTHTLTVAETGYWY